MIERKSGKCEAGASARKKLGGPANQWLSRNRPLGGQWVIRGQYTNSVVELVMEVQQLV
jgi:hypothetical protein